MGSYSVRIYDWEVQKLQADLVSAAAVCFWTLDRRRQRCQRGFGGRGRGEIRRRDGGRRRGWRMVEAASGEVTRTGAGSAVGGGAEGVKLGGVV